MCSYNLLFSARGLPSPMCYLVIASKISHPQSSLTSSLLSFSCWFFPNHAPLQDHTSHLVVTFLKSILILTDCLSLTPLLTLAFWGDSTHCPTFWTLGIPLGFFFFFLPSISYKLRVLKARWIQVECFLAKCIDDTKYTSFPPTIGWGQLIPLSRGHVFPVQA